MELQILQKKYWPNDLLLSLKNKILDIFVLLLNYSLIKHRLGDLWVSWLLSLIDNGQNIHEKSCLTSPHILIFILQPIQYPFINEKKREEESSCIKKAYRENRERELCGHESVFNTVPWKKQCNQWAKMCQFVSLLMEIESACGVFTHWLNVLFLSEPGISRPLHWPGLELVIVHIFQLIYFSVIWDDNGSLSVYTQWRKTLDFIYLNSIIFLFIQIYIYIYSIFFCTVLLYIANKNPWFTM